MLIMARKTQKKLVHDLKYSEKYFKPNTLSIKDMRTANEVNTS